MIEPAVVKGDAVRIAETGEIRRHRCEAPGPTIEAFRQGLREVGYIEGKNVLIEARFAEGRIERLPELVTEVLRLKVDVLVTGSPDGALAAKRANTTVSIVFAGVSDPVTAGIVPSLARPGANITGVTWGIGGWASPQSG